MRRTKLLIGIYAQNKIPHRELCTEQSSAQGIPMPNYTNLATYMCMSKKIETILQSISTKAQGGQDSL